MERDSFIAAPKDGLTSSQAADLLQRWGRNELEDKKIPKVLYLTIIEKFICQFEMNKDI